LWAAKLLKGRHAPKVAVCAPFPSVEEKNMKAVPLKVIVELVVVFSLIASLVFVGLQIKHDREVASVASVATASNDRKYMAELISENAEVWVKGLAGEPLTEIEKTIFRSLAFAYNLDHYASWYRARQLKHRNPGQFSTEFASVLVRNPGLLANWRETRERSAQNRVLTGGGQGGDVWGHAVEGAITQLDGTQ